MSDFRIGTGRTEYDVFYDQYRYKGHSEAEEHGDVYRVNLVEVGEVVLFEIVTPTGEVYYRPLSDNPPMKKVPEEDDESLGDFINLLIVGGLHKEIEKEHPS